MSALSDSDRKAYEQYILAATDQERQEAIKKLIPGSHLYYQLYFIDRFKAVGSKLTEEDKAMYEQFRKKYPLSQEFKEIELKLKLMSYDDSETQDQRNCVLSWVNSEYLRLDFNDQKPEDLQRQSESLSS